MLNIDIPAFDPAPKRGDLVHTNVGNKRERTWLVLKAQRVKRNQANSTTIRYKVHLARWWELNPKLRLALYRSAERNGGQRVIHFKPYPVRSKKKTFEQYMGGW